MLTPNELVDRARAIAETAHAGQTRRDGVTPYINHVEAVVSRVAHRGAAHEAIAVAYLHDVLEDTPLTATDLHNAGIPQEVIEAVFFLTKREDVPHSEYIKKIAANALAREVKIADMLANLGDAPTPKQIKRYAADLHTLAHAHWPNL